MALSSDTKDTEKKASDRTYELSYLVLIVLSEREVISIPFTLYNNPRLHGYFSHLCQESPHLCIYHTLLLNF